jgi:hypothetical protein
VDGGGSSNTASPACARLVKKLVMFLPNVLVLVLLVDGAAAGGVDFCFLPVDEEQELTAAAGAGRLAAADAEPEAGAAAAAGGGAPLLRADETAEAEATAAVVGEPLAGGGVSERKFFSA